MLWGRCYDHNFLPIFGEILAYFLKTNVMINCFQNLTVVWAKNAKFFGKNIFKNHNIGPCSMSMKFCSGETVLPVGEAGHELDRAAEVVVLRHVPRGRHHLRRLVNTLQKHVGSMLCSLFSAFFYFRRILLILGEFYQFSANDINLWQNNWRVSCKTNVMINFCLKIAVS
jgi:hypothetical protein